MRLLYICKWNSCHYCLPHILMLVIKGTKFWINFDHSYYTHVSYSSFFTLTYRLVLPFIECVWVLPSMKNESCYFVIIGSTSSVPDLMVVFWALCQSCAVYLSTECNLRLWLLIYLSIFIILYILSGKTKQLCEVDVNVSVFWNAAL